MVLHFKGGVSKLNSSSFSNNDPPPHCLTFQQSETEAEAPDGISRTKLVEPEKLDHPVVTPVVIKSSSLLNGGQLA